MKDMLICCLSNDGEGATVFRQHEYSLNGENNFMLSDRIDAQNFRLRKSASGYQSDWHVAGDPTLLIILSGTIQLELRSGETRDFSHGDMFIAEDYLKPGITFDNSIHGHRARVIGDKLLTALHLKLGYL